MKKLFIFSLVALLGLSSCADNDLVKPRNGKLTKPVRTTVPKIVPVLTAQELPDKEGYELWQVQLTADGFLGLVLAKVESYDTDKSIPYTIANNIICVFVVAETKEEAVTNARAFCRVNDVIPGI